MTASFAPFSSFPAFEGAEGWLAEQIGRYGANDVLEIGAGANPTLGLQTVTHLGVRRYTVNDLSPTELLKAPAGFDTLCCDFTDPSLSIREEYDFICSRLVNEHVADGRRYFENIFRALRPGGITVHAFSTLYTLPFLVNRLTPEWLSSILLDIFAPRDREQHEKFKAYYSWSRGPTKRQIRRFESLGFEVLEYTGYFGHEYYQLRLPALHRLEQRKADWLLRHPNPNLTSYAVIVLRRPR